MSESFVYPGALSLEYDSRTHLGSKVSICLKEIETCHLNNEQKFAGYECDSEKMLKEK